MERPADIGLPFFAYGLFRPGQLAYFQLRELVDTVTHPAEIKGRLLLRDGLPIIDPEDRGLTRGALLTLPGREGEAYDQISKMEPDNHYRWGKGQVNRKFANVLFGKHPKKGSARCDEGEWNGWSDPLFTEALEVVEETLKNPGPDGQIKRLFRLQMAYLLLWSSIERYVSLRYHLGGEVIKKIEQLADEPAFAESLLLRIQVTEPTKVHRADRPDDKEVLDPSNPKNSLLYFYQLQCNLTHRGKASFDDYAKIGNGLAQLLPIFRDVLKAAESDAKAGSGC
jgi:hypothetical protein